MIKLEQCRGCRDDFYNGNNPMGVARCWYAEDGRMVTRYRIGTWTRPTEPGAFTEVRVPSCYRQDGQHFSATVPAFVRAEDIVKERR